MIAPPGTTHIGECYGTITYYKLSHGIHVNQVIARRRPAPRSAAPVVPLDMCQCEPARTTPGRHQFDHPTECFQKTNIWRAFEKGEWVNPGAGWSPRCLKEYDALEEMENGPVYKDEIAT